MVTSKKPSVQAKYFYRRGWTKELDVAFINVRAWQAELGHKQMNPRRPNKIASDYACSAVDVYSETSKPRDLYLRKLDILRQRYTTFRRILDEPGFSWNEATNLVLASKES
ncbi:UNVERIFIED_CONTAM: hypothetical protein Sradi_3578600 [Sesamum radiatum]|uniref:Myb/SANT-like domain-containing protein n=1 Tax=Sesamum radiatum TaxID=300843 RepID=A0AAW2QGN5_SESRA